jgi:ABC-2 type transport system permease protein
MTPARVRRAYLVEARYEFLRMLRAPAFAGPFLALPVLLYLLFGVVLYGDAVRKDPKTGLFLFLGFAVFGVMGPGLFGFGVSVAMEREQGLLKLKRALPVPRGAALLAKMAMAILFVAIIMATMMLAATVGHPPLTVWQLLSCSAVNIVGAIPFCAMGLLIGTLTSGKAAPALVNIVYLPMIYLSGFLIPLPKSMQWIAQLSPAFHLHQLALAAMGAPSQGAPLVHIAVLAGVSVAFTALAVRRLERAG